MGVQDHIAGTRVGRASVVVMIGCVPDIVVRHRVRVDLPPGHTCQQQRAGQHPKHQEGARGPE